MVIMRRKKAPVVIFQEKGEKFDIFDVGDPFFFREFFFRECFHLFQREKLPKKLFLKIFSFFF